MNLILIAITITVFYLLKKTITEFLSADIIFEEVFIWSTMSKGTCSSSAILMKYRYFNRYYIKYKVFHKHPKEHTKYPLFLEKVEKITGKNHLG